MSYDFNAYEIFEMAERIEENGATFYRKAAEKITDKNNKAFLFDLALMEDQHKQIFHEMKKKLTKTDMVTTTLDLQNESLAYLKALADIRVFFKKEIDIYNMKSILEAAIMAEKDSIVFYLGMKDLVPEKMGKNKLDKIIHEEMKHIKLLSNKFSNL